ncbi:MAG: hypothetical protein V2A61_06460 [Calditrichota bacterium]
MQQSQKKYIWRWISLIALIAWGGISAPLRAEDQPLPRVTEQALQLYDQGRLSEAEHIALKALTEMDTLSRMDRFSLHRLLAFIAVANDDEDNGIKQFVLALRDNPSLSPDPITWSPKVRQVFGRARQEYESQIVLERRQKVASEAERGRLASLRSLYLPGSGQFLKGEPTKGAICAGLLAVSLTVCLYAAVTLPEARDRYHAAVSPDQAAKRWRDYRNQTYLLNISGLVAGAVYTYTFFDALWEPSPEQTSEQDISKLKTPIKK